MRGYLARRGDAPRVVATPAVDEATERRLTSARRGFYEIVLASLEAELLSPDLGDEIGTLTEDLG